jgi:hypothetical protein
MLSIEPKIVQGASPFWIIQGSVPYKFQVQGGSIMNRYSPIPKLTQNEFLRPRCIVHDGGIRFVEPRARGANGQMQRSTIMAPAPVQAVASAQDECVRRRVMSNIDDDNSTNSIDRNPAGSNSSLTIGDTHDSAPTVPNRLGSRRADLQSRLSCQCQHYSVPNTLHLRTTDDAAPLPATA